MMSKAILTWLAVLSVAVMPYLGFAQDQPTVTIEVLAAKTEKWSNPYTIPGSPGTTYTDCSIDDDRAKCISQTEGRTADVHRRWPHRLVTASFRMPDGNILTATCHERFRWNFCPEPEPGRYQAKIGKHDIRLLFSVQTKRPEYNRDGTLKRAAEFQTKQAKFIFR